MNRRTRNRRKQWIVMAAGLLLTTLLVFVLLPGDKAFAKSTEDVRILFTTDLHSNLSEHEAWMNDKGERAGGFARLKTVIDENREEGKTLLFDSGDFSIGSLYQNYTESDALELDFMQEMGYDAVALGNHDFDIGEEGLKNELIRFRKKGGTFPLLCSNLTPGGESVPKGPDSNPYVEQGVHNYSILEVNGLRVGVFALMGDDAVQYTKVTTMSFADKIKSAQQMVKELQKENVDMIVLLSHCGTVADGSFHEDADIAEAVTGIDLILSGHMHIPMQEAQVVNGTTIVCAGTAGNYLGRLDATRTGDAWEYTYQLIPVTDRVKEDAKIKVELAPFTNGINKNYLAKYGLTEKMDDVICYSPYDFRDGDTMALSCENYAFGSLLADSYLSTLRDMTNDEVQVAIVPVGVVRAGIYSGDITVMDAVNVLSYGTSPIDGSSGAPMCIVSLNGRELYDICETSVSLSPIVSTAQILMSGMRYTYSNTRPLLNKVISVEVLNTKTGEYEKVNRDEETLYRVAGSWTSMQSIALVGDNSYGLLQVAPKNEAGEILETPEQVQTALLFDENGNEIKEWYMLVDYLKKMPTNIDGLPQISKEYNKTPAYMIEKTGIFSFFGSMNKPAIIQYVIVLVLVFIVALIVFLIVHSIKKKAPRP